MLIRLTGEELRPKPLFGTAAPIPTNGDRREAFATWLTSDANPYFAQVAVNRVWADMMGRGLVEPVDDLRVTNPASNEPLLSAIAKDFQQHDYDLKHLIRTIASSYVYSLSSLPSDRNAADTRNHSRYYRQRMRAEVLLDSVSQFTESPASFVAMPKGSLAKQVWTHRVGSLFLDTFGRPDPNQDPPCERTTAAAVTQTLHMMNGRQLQNKLGGDNGRAARLAKEDADNDAVIDELYLASLSRFPDNEEREIAQRILSQLDTSRRHAIEDLMWSLMNTAEFIFKD